MQEMDNPEQKNPTYILSDLACLYSACCGCVSQAYIGLVIFKAEPASNYMITTQNRNHQDTGMNIQYTTIRKYTVKSYYQEIIQEINWNIKL